MKLLKNLSIKYQLWGGLGITLLFMAIVAFIAIFRFSSIEQQTNTVSLQLQPTMIAALKLQNSINNNGKLLGYYMVNVSKQNAARFKQSAVELKQYFNDFKKFSKQINNEELNQYTKKLIQLNSRYIALQDRLNYLTEHPFENKPGLNLARTIINPSFKEVVQILELMIESELEEDRTEGRDELLHTLLDIRQNWMLTVASLRMYISSPEKSREAEISIYINRHEKLIKRLETFQDIYTFEEEEGAAQLKEKGIAYFGAIEKLFEISHEGHWRKDSLLIQNELAPLMVKIDETTNQLVDYLQASVVNGNQHIVKQMNSAQVTLIILLLIALTVGFFVAITSSAQVSTLISEVKNSLQSIASGDLSIHLDENRMGEVGEMAQTINQFADELRKMIQNMQASSHELQSAAHRMRDVIASASENIRQQHNETEQVASAAEEMSAVAQETAHHASAAAESAQRVNEGASSGAQISTQAMNNMKMLTNDLNSASSVIQELEAESGNISMVLDVISGISEQTNLLALNAAIEAARAGEQGRGFAVVADEVRTLASKTQESTNQIKELIDKLQAGSSNAVQAMNNSIKQVDTNNQQVQQVASALNDIASEIGNINNMLAQMETSSHQQSQTSNEISQNIAAISTLAEKTSQGTEDLSQAESNLENVANNLNQIISRFRV